MAMMLNTKMYIVASVDRSGSIVERENIPDIGARNLSVDTLAK